MEKTIDNVDSLATNITSGTTTIPEELKLSLREELFASFQLLLEKKVADMECFYKKELANRDNTICKMQTRIGDLERRAGLTEIFLEKQRLDTDDNQQYSRKRSLRLYGMEKKKKKETADDVLNEVFNEMDRLDSPIDEIEVDRAHRSGKAYKDPQGKWQQPVLLRFVSWKSRNIMYRSRKSSRFYMKADLTKRKEEVFEYAREEIGVEGSLASKLINYVYVDANCSLIAFTSSGRFLHFNTKEEFNESLLYLENTTRASEIVYDIIEQQLANTCPGE